MKNKKRNRFRLRGFFSSLRKFEDPCPFFPYIGEVRDEKQKAESVQIARLFFIIIFSISNEVLSCSFKLSKKIKKEVVFAYSRTYSLVMVGGVAMRTYVGVPCLGMMFMSTLAWVPSSSSAVAVMLRVIA